jgi:RNA polymerase sigma-70 factor, ECF subfamily
MTLDPQIARTSQQEEDRQLLRRVARKDRQAFETLYRRYYRRVFQFSLRLVRNEAAAEEVVGDVMFAVWQGAESFAGGSSVSTWILGIAFRQSMKTLDRNRKHARVDCNEELVDTTMDPDPSADPEWSAITDSDGALLQAGMMALAEHHRVVVELTALGHSYGEIAQIIDCCENTVKTRMFHARQQLKRFIAGAERGGAASAKPVRAARGEPFDAGSSDAAFSVTGH